MPHLTEKHRRWLYSIVLVAVPLLVAYGIMDANHAPLWSSLAAAILAMGGSGLAIANVGVEPEEYTGRHRLEG